MSRRGPLRASTCTSTLDGHAACAARSSGRCATRCGAAASARDTAPVLAGARARPRARAEHGRGGVRPARGGGLARGPAGCRHARRAPPGVGPGRHRARRPPPRAPQFDLRPGVPDLSVVPARRMARRGATGAARRRRSTRSATATRAVASSCDARSPSTSPVRAAWSPRRSGSSSAPASSRDCPWSGPRSTRPGRPRRTATPRTAAGSTRRRFAVDAEGAVVSELGRRARVLLTPAHQFPLGSTLSPRRRRDVVAWARTTGGVVVEDDYDGEFRYDRRPVGAMQSLAPEHVVYAGTASKSLAPGVRLGWLVVPARSRSTRARGACPRRLAECARPADARRADRIRRLRPPGAAHADRLPAAARPCCVATRHGFPVERVIDAGLHAVVPSSTKTKPATVERRGADGELRGRARGALRRASLDPALVVGYGTPPEHA